jgi:asparagine N-glycosylation enzyme membrane subunit Stt3
MEETLFVTRLLGIVTTVASLSLLLNRKFYAHAVRKYIKDEGFLLLSGLLALVAGASILLLHPTWNGWHMLIPLIGLFALVKGASLLLFPQSMISLTKSLTRKSTWVSFAIIDLA